MNKYKDVIEIAQYAYQIFKFVQKKFSQQQQDAQKAKKLYPDDSTELSTIFQGDIDLEKRKQSFFKLWDETTEQVRNFLTHYKFQKLYDTDMIKQQYYFQDVECCVINLQEIQIDKFFIFTQECGTTNPVIWLNKALEKIFHLLIQFISGEFTKSLFQDELENYYQEILEFLQQEILKQAKECLKGAYQQIDLILQSACQNVLENDIKFNEIVYQISNSKANLIHNQQKLGEAFKILLQKFDQQVLLDIQVQFLENETQETRQKFFVADLLILQYHKIIEQKFKKKILSSINFHRFGDFSNLAKQVQISILSQVEKENFNGGIEIKEINKALLLIITSINWIELGIDLNQVQNLINQLQKSCNECSALNQNAFNLNLQNFSDQNQKKCIKAKEWYNQNVDEKTNVLVICQLYTILSMKFKNSKLNFIAYDSESRNILFQVVRHLNDLKFGYFNHQLVKLCENLTYQISTQIFKDIDQKITKIEQEQQSAGELFKSRSEIKLQEKTYHFSLQDPTYNIQNAPSMIGRQYHTKNLLFETILETKESNLNQQQKKQEALINLLFQELQQQIREKKQNEEYQLVKELIFPSLFYFETLSSKKHNSNVITLVISGFCSKNVDKLSQWKLAIQQFSGTVIALHWETKHFFDICTQISQIVNLDSLLQVFDNNPFTGAKSEATSAGRCLAHFLDQGQLLGDKQINIMCHSLGSQIVLELVHELDRFSKKKIINDILIFGGAIDVSDFQKRRWNSVSGQIHNIYSQNDSILKLLLKVQNWFSKPCGLHPISIGYRKFLNYDLTDEVNGHLNYWQNLDKIINITDFNSDYKVLVNNLIEKS